MSKLAKLYLAAAAAKVSNEDITDATFPNLDQDRAPAEDTAPAEVPAEVVAEVPAEEAPVAEEPAAVDATVSAETEEAPAATEEAPVAEVTEEAPAQTEEVAPAAAEEEPRAEEEAVTADVIGEQVAEDAADAILGDDDHDFEDDDNADAEERAYEFVRASADVRDERGALEALQITVEGLKDFHSLLSHLNSTGGVTKEVLAFAQIGLEAYSFELDQPSIMLGVSVESFEEADQRQEVSLEHLEHFIGELEAIAPTLQDSIVSVEARLTEFARDIAPRTSLESLAVSNECGCRDMDADTLVAASTSDQQAQDNVLAQGLNAAEAGIVQVRDEIVQQNTAGGLSQEALVAASLALDAFTKPMGLPEIVLADNLDAFGEGARAQVSVEAIDLGLEGIKDFIKGVGKAIASAAKKSVIAVKNALNMLNGTLPTAIKELEEFLARVEKAEKTKTVGKVDGKFAKRFHDGGKLPSDIPAYLIEFAAFATRFMGSYMSAAQTAMAENTRAFNNLDLNSAPGFEASLKKIAGQWKDSRKGLNGGDFKATIPGEGSVFQDGDNVTYAGNDPFLKALADQANHNVLHGTALRKNRKLTDKVDQIPAMTVDQMLKVGKVLLAMLKGIKTERLEVQSTVITQYWAVQLFLNRAPKVIRKDVEVLRRGYMWGTVTPALEFGWSMARSCVRVARSFIAYGNRSLSAVSTEGLVVSEEGKLGAAAGLVAGAVLGGPAGAAVGAVAGHYGQKLIDHHLDKHIDKDKKKVSKESDETGAEEVSMEGADPKKLKSGIKVKFSHGHGKITKVFTAPFMFGGKHHKASKDDPRYLVKADQGGHQSTHKASSLTIV